MLHILLAAFHEDNTKAYNIYFHPIYFFSNKYSHNNFQNISHMFNTEDILSISVFIHIYIMYWGM